MYCVCISSPSNESFIEFITVCSLVLITSCNVNPRFLLRLHDSSVLQSIIIFNAKSLPINLLYDCFISSSTNSYLCFLYILLYLFVTSGNFLCLNCSSICLSFTHNALTLSTITSMSLFSSVSLVIFSFYIIPNKNLFSLMV